MKKMILAFLVALVPVSASAQYWSQNGVIGMAEEQDRGKDRYNFDHPEWFHPNVEIKFEFVNSSKELRELFKQRAPNATPERQRLMAFSSINPNTNKCTIWAVKPTTSYQPEYIGHEVLHCIYGRFHD